MCGRFQLSVKGKEISERFNVEVFNDIYSPSFNCAPSQKLPVITNRNPEVLSFFQWGLIPSWSRKPRRGINLINARSETILHKSVFKKAFERQRCLIPANGFFEWRKNDKVPFRIFLKDESLFAMAGIWDTWYDADNNAFNTFCIITTEANTKMKAIHHRMPVIIPVKEENTWLKSNNISRLTELLKPINNTQIEMYPVSSKVNAPKNNSKELIYPVSMGEQGSIF